MKLYLVRHGRALPAENDQAQPLSLEGRDDIMHLARTLGHMNIRVQTILHSGKLRSEESARLIADVLQPAGGVVRSENLGPTDDIGPMLQKIRTATEDLMLVGHLPFLANLLQALVEAPDQDDLPVFDTGILVGVEKLGNRWQVFRHLGPRMIM